MATVLTNVGEQWVCDFLSGVSALLGDDIGWGTGAGTAAKGDTTLFTEASEARVAGTRSTNGSGASATFRVVGTITADGTKTITNAGLFDAATAGNLISHRSMEKVVQADRVVDSLKSILSIIAIKIIRRKIIADIQILVAVLIKIAPAGLK